MIKTGSDFSGVGAFDQALDRLEIKQDKLFACDMDKYARQTYILNFGEPKYYPKDVYEREIPKESLDIYMTSPPCQAFSLAGKRKGEDDKRGILFYNSHEFIQKNKPRFFIFENVKGLLSDDSGKTFQRWIDYLGGKTVNGNPVIFPHEDSVPYHVYYQVLNAKHYGIPQNRERIFIIGIRDDEDNNFSFPKPFPLEKRLKDVLETEVDEKYFLSDKMLNHFATKEGVFSGMFKPMDSNSNGTSSCIPAVYHKIPITNTYINEVNIGTWRTHEDGKGFRATEDNNCPTIPARAREDGSGQPVIKIGAIRGRNPDNPKSRQSGLETEQMLEINENGTSNALTTVQKDNVVVYDLTNDFGEETPREYTEFAPALRSSRSGLATNSNQVIIPANNSKGFDLAEEEDSINFSNPNSETRRGRVGKKVSQTLDTQCNQGIATRKLTKQEQEELIGVSVHPFSKKLEYDGPKDLCPTLLATDYKATKTAHFSNQRIRRLTPLECFKLMDFNFGIPGVKDFVWEVSDSQAYKEAGNSICVGVLVEIIKKLNL